MGWHAKPRFEKQRRIWYCRWKGKKHYLGTNEAQAWAKFYEITQTKPATPRTIAATIDAWRLSTGANDWKMGRLRAWGEYAGLRRIADLPRDHLGKYARWLSQKSLSAKTIRHNVQLAHTVLSWCKDQGWISDVPARPKTRPPIQRPRDYKPFEIRQTLKSVPIAGGRCCLRFIVETGARPAEARMLCWDEIDWDNRCATKHEHKTAHKGKPRHIWLSDRMLRMLRAIPKRNRFVFLNRLGNPYTKDGLRAILQNAAAVAKTDVRNPYGLRHTFAQQLLESGVSYGDVAALLGHSGISQVQVYAQVRPPRLRSLAASLNSPLRGATPSHTPHPKPSKPSVRKAARRPRPGSAKTG